MSDRLWKEMCMSRFGGRGEEEGRKKREEGRVSELSFGGG
jgi:hypothetical protein